MKWLNKLSASLLHGTFFILMLLSIFLYKERLFADSAYYFFHAINSSWFHIEADRITIALSQIFPLTAAWLGFPLKYLLVIYSLGHELFFYALFLLLLYQLKDKTAAVLFLLMHLIGQLHLFYIPFVEISYGAGLAIVFFSILRTDKWKDDKWLIFFLLVEWLVLFSHPENLYLIPVLLFFDFLNRGLIRRIHFASISIFFIGLGIKALNFSSYDQKKLGNSLSEPAEQISAGNYIGEVWEVYLQYYPELLLFFGLSIAFLSFQRKWKLLAFSTASLAFLLFLINKIEPTNTFYWYVEVVNTPVVFLVLFFFMFTTWEGLSTRIKEWAILGLLLMALLRITWIWSYGEPLRERTAQLERLVDYAQGLGHSKYLINEANYKKPYSEITWANPIEALLFSAIDGKEKTVSIITDQDLAYSNNKEQLNDSTFLFRKFNAEPLSFLNPRYFELKKEGYHLLNNSGFSAPYKEIAKSTAITPVLPLPLLLKHADTLLLRVQLKNESGAFIPSSVEEQVFLSYHWIKEDELFDWDGLRTPLEVDLIGNYQQDLFLATPAEKGSYQLQTDFLIEGKDWFGLSEKYKVIVH